MEAFDGKPAGGDAAAVLRCLALIAIPPAQAADSRCPIIMLPSANGATRDVTARQDLPDSQPPW